MANVVILASGGMKAGVAAATLAADNHLVFVHVHYGQRSATAERAALRACAKSFQSSRVLTLGLPHLMQLQKAVLDKGSERADARDQPSGNNELPRLSSTSVRGMMPMLLLQAVQCALRVGATKVLTGLTQFCDATHLGLPPVEGPRGDRRDFLHAFNSMLESVLTERSFVVVEAPGPVRVQGHNRVAVVNSARREAERSLTPGLSIHWESHRGNRRECPLGFPRSRG